MLPAYAARARPMFPYRYITDDDVRRALPMRAAIEATREAFALLAAGRVEMPLRSAIPLEAPPGALLVMSARAGRWYGTKLVTVLRDPPARDLPRVHAVMVLFDPETAEPVWLDAEALTAIRTGAVSGLATELLAREDATRVAIIGAGTQARTQLDAVCCVRKIERARVWSRTSARASRFAAEMRGVGSVPAEIAVAASVDAAVDGADIVCLATPATAPLLLARHVQPGMHVNAVGSFRADMCEFEPAILSEALVVVDQREAALAEAGEVMAAVRDGEITAAELVELGALVDTAPSPDRGRVTVFKSVGLAVQDVVVARRLLGRLDGP